MPVPEPSDSDRSAILGQVRRALGRTGAAQGAADATPAAVRDRLAHPLPNTVPLRARLQQPALTELFVEMATASLATVARCADRDAVPTAVRDYLRGLNLPERIVLPAASSLGHLDWEGAGLAVERRLVRSGDAAALGTAAAGIAETGTLVVCSGPANPVTGNFLPEHHLLVLEARHLVPASEDLWASLREQSPEGRAVLPRTLHWITGPSRSGDIEMTMLMGAHGPVALHVILIDGVAGASTAAPGGGSTS
jgi:L-lactate dehydrogenase complex protein LldG